MRTLKISFLLFVLLKSCFILVGDIQPLANLANPAFLLSSPKEYSSIRATVTVPQKKDEKGDGSTEKNSKRFYTSKIILDNTVVKIEFWDFGGQFEFYTTHHSLLSYRSQYLLVLDLSKDLENVVQEEDIDPLRHRQLSVKGNWYGRISFEK